MNPPDPAILAQLRDIHLPGAVSLWPLAAGWWIGLALLIGFALAALALHRIRRHRADSWQAATGRELARIEHAFDQSKDPLNLAVELSALLRRAAIARTGDPQVAALRGDAWFEFVSAQTHEDRDRSRHVLRELTNTTYRRGAADPVDTQAWIAFMNGWISEAG